MPLLDEVETIATTRGQAPNAAVADEVGKIQRWALLDHDLMPSVIDVYYKALAVALSVAGVGDMEARTLGIEDDSLDFWEACDDLVHKASGYTRPEFQGVKTTLAGVEQIWRERDWELVRSGMPLAEAFEVQSQKIHESVERRRAIARGIAYCAGWLDE